MREERADGRVGLDEDVVGVDVPVVAKEGRWGVVRPILEARG